MAYGKYLVSELGPVNISGRVYRIGDKVKDEDEMADLIESGHLVSVPRATQAKADGGQDERKPPSKKKKTPKK